MAVLCCVAPRACGACVSEPVGARCPGCASRPLPLRVSGRGVQEVGVAFVLHLLPAGWQSLRRRRRRRRPSHRHRRRRRLVHAELVRARLAALLLTAQLVLQPARLVRPEAKRARVAGRDGRLCRRRPLVRVSRRRRRGRCRPPRRWLAGRWLGRRGQHGGVLEGGRRGARSGGQLRRRRSLRRRVRRLRRGHTAKVRPRWGRW
mmetsp:Transcript_31790/g.94778  ORF Transcript_31790/g.94778 Transcript_31790/m.94778 type:complete len:204 (-) Transcript_31790:6-617(-)